MTRHFLRDDDLTPAEQAEVLQLAATLKAERHAKQPLAGPQGVAIIFDKPTLRTQLSFSVAVAELGGHPMIVDGNLAQIGTRESIHDVANVIGRQVSAIVWRTYGQEWLDEMARHAGVPVVNALTDDFHPCQILADLLTVTEHKGRVKGLRVTYVGDAANNMAHSYLLGFATAGAHITVAGPAEHQPRADILERTQQIAATTGGSPEASTDVESAVEDADVVITDTWVSMGMEAEKAERQGEANPFAPFAVTTDLMHHAKPDAVVLHCLPAYRGFEIETDVIDGPQSVVWDEAENRLHAQKALLTFLVEQS